MTNKIDKLALFGGQKVIDYEFNPYNSIGEEEIEAAIKVLRNGKLSGFYASNTERFYGGEYVRKLEDYCKDYFQVNHVISTNSWTSGLICAVGALDLEPGDEVITSPWTMCATATAILHFNALPVFADIDPRTFNLSPSSIEKNITKYTKAILAVDIFGQSCDIDKIMQIASKYNLKVITDTAQSPGSKYKDKYSGTISDIGGFSLNCHKHIQTGEGGLIVTNDSNLAERMQLIRNHGEAVVESKKIKKISNIIGYNFRLGEIESAIAIEQLKKLDKIVKSRQKIANYLNNHLNNLFGLQIPHVENFNTHSYYVYSLLLDTNAIGLSRETILKALEAEGLKGVYGKYNLLYDLPIYKKKIAYGTKGFPWNSDICKREINYNRGICPVAESMQDEQFIGLGLCNYNLNEFDLENIVNVFHKVWNNLKNLQDRYC